MNKLETLCDEYRENKRLIEELSAMNDSLKNEILEIMGPAETMTAGAAKIINKTIISNRFDSTGFKKAYPDLFKKFSKETCYKRFTVA